MFEVGEAASTATAKRQPFPKHPIRPFKVHLNNFLIYELSPAVLRQSERRPVPRHRGLAVLPRSPVLMNRRRCIRQCDPHWPKITHSGNFDRRFLSAAQSIA